jgi:hypothetical protein
VELASVLESHSRDKGDFEMKIKSNKEPKKIITQEELKRLLHYDPITGDFTWIIIPKRGKVKIGEPAGGITGGRERKARHIGINGKIYTAHSLAFLYMEGYFPEESIKHKDNNNDNNQWKNLQKIIKPPCIIKKSKKELIKLKKIKELAKTNKQKKKMKKQANWYWKSSEKSKFIGVTRNYNGKWNVSITINKNSYNLGGYYSNQLDASLAIFTFTQQCSFIYKHQYNLIKGIKKLWPEFPF